MFVALFACNLIGVSLHFSMVSLASEAGRYFKVAIYLFIASWIAFIGGIYVFVWSCREFMLRNPDDTGMPMWVLVLIWMVVVQYSLFGFVASRFYLPRLTWWGPITAEDAKSEDWNWLTTYFDWCSVLIKLPVAWTIFMKGAIVSCERSYVC